MTTAPGGAEEAPAFSPEEMARGEALFAIAWGFFKSVPALEFLPEADRPEIAFAGRSNVGKSSLINALVRRRGLARASNTPGRTQELNFFLAADAQPAFYLVDMPGYGFAKAPKGKVDDWTRLVKDYLRGRTTLGRVFLLIDARHGPKPIDVEIMDLLDQSAVSYQLVLTKADKISASGLARSQAAARALIEKHPAAFPELITTSSEDGLGLDLLRARIALTIAERA